MINNRIAIKIVWHLLVITMGLTSCKCFKLNENKDPFALNVSIPKDSISFNDTLTFTLQFKNNQKANTTLKSNAKIVFMNTARNVFLHNTPHPIKPPTYCLLDTTLNPASIQLKPSETYFVTFKLQADSAIIDHLGNNNILVGYFDEKIEMTTGSRFSKKNPSVLVMSNCLSIYIKPKF